MKPYKEIHYNIYCAAKQPEALPPNTIYSRSCALNIITEGAISSQPGMIRYELSVEDELDTHMLHLNHFSFIRLHPNQKKVYALNFVHPSPQATALAFSLDSKYGSVEACLRINKLEGECWQSANVKADGQGFTDSFKRLLLNYTTHAGQIGGEYDLELKAGEMGAGLTLGTNEIFSDFNTPKTAREIKAGLPLTEHLTNFSHVAYYTFQLARSDSADGVNLIVISLTPITGKFSITVRNDDLTPSIGNAQWYSETNEIVIRKGDEFFKENSRYMIAITPIVEVDYDESFRYQLKWSYLDKHDVMASGVANFGTIPEDKKCFVAEILPSHKSVMFMKSGNDALDVYISLGNENHLPQSYNYEFKIGADQSGVQINKQQIDEKCRITFELKKYCNAYVCINGKTSSEFMLTFVADDQPITLIDGKIFEGPIPIGNKELRFIYHPQKTKSFDIEEFSVKQNCKIAANIEEYKSSSGYVWPGPEQGKVASQASIVHVSREKLQNYTNPVVLVTLSRAANVPAASNDQDFNFDSKFSLEAGAELKELTEHKQRVVVATQAMWNYFYFYNYHPTEDIVIGLDSLDGGDADMFVGRGKDSRPTELAYLERSTGFRSSYIDLNLDHIRGKGHKDMSGYYVIGVKSNSDIRFSIYWKHSKSSIIKASYGEQHSVMLQPGSKAHVVLYNLLKGDVELVVNVHHQPLTVYWHSYQKSNASIPEEFPTAELHQRNFTIEDINPISLIQVDSDSIGACVNCKYMYTLVNPNIVEPIKIDFFFDLKNSASEIVHQVVKSSVRMYGALAAGQSRRYHLNVPAMDKATMEGYYFEVHMLHGEGDMSAKMDSTSDAPTTLFTDRVKSGFNKVSLKQLADNNQFNQADGYRGISLTNVMFDLSCRSACTYRLVLVRPEHFTELNINEGREFFIENEKTVESFLYHAIGQEKHFDLSFIIKQFTDENLHSVSNDDLKSLVTVRHVKDKADLDRSTVHTALKPLHIGVDGMNGKLHVSYPVIAGYYVVEVKGLKQTGFVYRLEVNTHIILTLLAGRQTVSVVPENSTHRTFEFYPHQPGSVYAKVSRCFGDASISVKELGVENTFQPVEVENDKYTSVIQATGSGKPVYLKASKPLNLAVTSNEFGYLDHSKNVSVVSVEMFGSRAWSKIDFESLKPFNEEVYIDLKSSAPVIQFRPIWFENGDNRQYQVRYFVAVSKDPEALEFYAGCDYSMMSRVLKQGFSPEDAVQVYSMPMDTPVHMELGPLKPYHLMSLPLASGHRYFALVFAQVSIKKNDEEGIVGTSDSLRIKYARIEFEYRSFFYPIELMAATIGLIGLMVASCCVFNSKLSSLIKKQLRFKQVAESDVDTDLEEYFMRIKYDYDQLSAGRQSTDTSGIVDSSIDASFRDNVATNVNREEPVQPTAEIQATNQPLETEEKEDNKGVELV
jgi:hypothetical protein